MSATSIASGATPATRLPLALPRFGDERLARLVASGNESAFAAIYERYHRHLYRYCRSIVRHDADAQDVLQSALASAFLALKRGQRDAPLRPWLFRIVHNEAISLIRRRRSEKELDRARERWAGSAEYCAGERERLALLVADLQELPDRQRAALVMRELSGLSHEEIGVALDISLGAAKQAIFEARRALMEFEQGRSMICEEVRRKISDLDRRALRGRRVRAHLRDCAGCNAFASAIPARREELRVLVPALPSAASATVLARILGAQSGHGAASGAGAGIAGTGAVGKTVGATLAAKALTGATILVTAAAGVAGLGAVLPSSHHSMRGSVSAQRAGTGAGDDLTQAGTPTLRSPASASDVQHATRADRGPGATQGSAHGSSGTPSDGDASNAVRHVQGAGAVGPRGGPDPVTGERAHGAPASSSAASNSAVGQAQGQGSARANPAPVHPVRGALPAPRVATPRAPE